MLWLFSSIDERQNEEQQDDQPGEDHPPEGLRVDPGPEEIKLHPARDQFQGAVDPQEIPFGLHGRGAGPRRAVVVNGVDRKEGRDEQQPSHQQKEQLGHHHRLLRPERHPDQLPLPPASSSRRCLAVFLLEQDYHMCPDEQGQDPGDEHDMEGIEAGNCPRSGEAPGKYQVGDPRSNPGDGTGDLISYPAGRYRELIEGQQIPGEGRQDGED